jgi:hypothetical protein
VNRVDRQLWLPLCLALIVMAALPYRATAAEKTLASAQKFLTEFLPGHLVQAPVSFRIQAVQFHQTCMMGLGDNVYDRRFAVINFKKAVFQGGSTSIVVTRGATFIDQGIQHTPEGADAIAINFFLGEAERVMAAFKFISEACREEDDGGW